MRHRYDLRLGGKSSPKISRSSAAVTTERPVLPRSKHLSKNDGTMRPLCRPPFVPKKAYGRCVTSRCCKYPKNPILANTDPSAVATTFTASKICSPPNARPLKSQKRQIVLFSMLFASASSGTVSAHHKREGCPGGSRSTFPTARRSNSTRTAECTSLSGKVAQTSTSSRPCDSHTSS